MAAADFVLDNSVAMRWAMPDRESRTGASAPRGAFGFCCAICHPP